MERKSFGPDNSLVARRGRIRALLEAHHYQTPVVRELPSNSPAQAGDDDFNVIPIKPPDYEQPNADQLAA